MVNGVARLSLNLAVDSYPIPKHSGSSSQVGMWCFCEDFGCFIAWLDRWQDLISGVLALLAAAGAAVLLWKQIEIQKRQVSDEAERANDARDRRGLSLRAKMPFALSSLSNYAEACFDWAWDPLLTTTNGSPPTLPSEAVERIAELIEFTDNRSARHLATLVAQCQINDARIQNTTTDNDDNIIMAVVIRWLADSAFAFGRLEVDHYSPVASEADVGNALRIMAHAGLTHSNSLTRPMVDRVLPRAVRFARRLTAPVEPAEDNSPQPSLS